MGKHTFDKGNRRAISWVQLVADVCDVYIESRLTMTFSGSVLCFVFGRDG
eukprot:COSAG05_NODE_2064_length_3620_cov_1.541323_4_plen_50_part_00